MKKSILAIALTAMVSLTASAVSVSWTSSALSFNGTSLKSNSNVSAYLLSIDGALASYTIDDAFFASSIGTAVSSVNTTVKSGKAQGKFSFTLGEFTDGDKFALLVSYVDSESGDTYFNLSSVINTLSGVTTEVSTPIFNEFTINNGNGTDPSLAAGGGWVKALADAPGPGGDDPTPGVPEPATGALALAGLALLFRRKRA